MSLEGRVAIVTGSSRGLGKAMALTFASAGADVVVVGRTEQTGGPLAGTIHETAEAITSLGRKALPISCDISREEDDVEAMGKQVPDAFRQFEILINNPAVPFQAPFAQTLWGTSIRCGRSTPGRSSPALRLSFRGPSSRGETVLSALAFFVLILPT